MKKIEIGKTYENTAGGLRLITPLSRKSDNIYCCEVTELCEGGNLDKYGDPELIEKTYTDTLTASDILH